MFIPSQQPQVIRSVHHVAHRWFWSLVVVAVLATGSLSSAFGAAPSPFTGLRVAASGLVLITSLTLATRVMSAAERIRRKARKGQT
jgi:uncharacterized membrane protein